MELHKNLWAMGEHRKTDEHGLKQQPENGI